jgi:hypothetical protein
MTVRPPLFSIVIPAKGRPHYTWDAVFSAMHQDFDDFDVTLSNNGADPSVKAAVAEFMADPRFRYIEQPSVLDMALHWEMASRAAMGDYFLLLNNRCVLKQGVLRQLSKFLKGESSDVEIVSWRCDEYDKASALLSPCPSYTGTVFRLKTSDALLRFARGSISCMHNYETLPLAMNSCVSRSVVERIRHRQGHAFRSIDPTLTFALSCLLNANEVVHFDEPLYVSQGLEVSNGAKVVRGDVGPYINSLGLADPWEDVPIKAPLVFNSAARDFLVTLREYGRNDIRAEWNRLQYYMECLVEIRIKRKAGILTASEIGELEKAVALALQNEDESIRASVAPPITRTMLRKAKTLARIIFGSAVDFIRPHRHRPGGNKKFRSALEAAGFQNIDGT